jgi:hypothetical protein
MRLRFVFLVVICALSACKSKTGGAPPAAGASASARAQAPSSPSGSTAPPTPAASSFDSASARQLVERWLSAQNEHDFAAYSALYAARFSGTKRVGSYTKRFDRAGWLRDRQPMFRDGVVVQATDLQLSGTANAVRVVFTQDFVAPGFHDRGAKELFLVAQSGGLLIAREEMLESRVAEAAPITDSAVLAFHRDGPVVERGFGSKPTDEPRLLSRGQSDAYEAALPLAPGVLPEATRAWLGRSVVSYALDGGSCQGTVARFEVRVSAEPHFGMRQAWNGEDGAKKATPKEIAHAIWDMARDDERFVVAVLDHECKGIWAATHPTPFTPARSPAQPTKTAALKAFKALPAYRELQARFAREAANSSQAWESVDGELHVVELRTTPESALVVVSARGGSGCGGFSGNLSAIWKVTGADARATFALRGVFKDSADLIKVHGALDQNNDGSLELLAGPDVFAGEISVLRLGSNGYERKALFATSFWDCGC